MALLLTLYVNDDRIGALMIQRVEPLDPTPGPDDVGTYRVEMDHRAVGTLRHRYGDGPWPLVRRALNLALFAAAPATTTPNGDPP